MSSRPCVLVYKGNNSTSFGIVLYTINKSRKLGNINRTKFNEFKYIIRYR